MLKMLLFKKVVIFTIHLSSGNRLLDSTLVHFLCFTFYARTRQDDNTSEKGVLQRLVHTIDANVTCDKCDNDDDWDS